VAAATVGTVKLVLDQDVAAAAVKVTAEDGTALPFTLHERALEFFAGAPGSARVVAGDSEYIYSLTLPQLADTWWDPPTDARPWHPALSSRVEFCFRRVALAGAARRRGSADGVVFLRPLPAGRFAGRPAVRHEEPVHEEAPR